jgi:hypothetical protein
VRKKIKVFDSTGKEVVDEKIRKATLAAMRKVKKPRIQEMETYSRQCRKQNIIDAKDKPYIVGIKWNLGMHLTNDICGKLATQDSYGMGRGVYPKEKYPDIPHDNCHCWDSYVFDNEYFKNNPPSEELIQQVKKDAKYPEFQKWAEEWLKRIKE